MKFQEHVNMQMWLLSRIIWYVAWFYIASLVLFALLRVFTGVSIKRLGYFSLRHISIHMKQGLELRIGKLGIQPHRPTVAQPGLVTFVLSNVELVVDIEFLIDHEEELARQKSAAAQENDLAAATETVREAFDGSKFKGVPLIPKSKKLLLKALRWTVTHIRVFDINIVSVSFVFSGLMSIVATGAKLRVDSRKTLNYKRSNFVGTLDSHKLSDCELPLTVKLSILDVYIAESLEDESPWQAIDDLRFDVMSVLSLDEMRLNEMAVKVQADCLTFDVRYLVDIMKKVSSMRARSRTAASQEKPAESVSAPEVEDEKGAIFGTRDKERMVHASEVLLYLVKSVQITIGAFEAVRIPVTLHHHEADVRDDPNLVMMAIGMKDMNLDLSRMSSQSAGFRLLYEKDDLAHQFIFMMASLNISFDNGHVQEEVMYVPMLTGLNRGNLFSQTLRYARSSDPGKVNGAQMRSRWATNAPTISLEEHQMPAFVRLMMGFITSQNDECVHTADGDDSNDSSDDVDRRELGRRLQHMLPNFDIELLVADGTSRMRFNDTDEYRNAIFVASSETLLVSLHGQHTFDRDDDDYEHHEHRSEQSEQSEPSDGHDHSGESGRRHSKAENHGGRRLSHAEHTGRAGLKVTANFETKNVKAWYHSSNLSRFDIVQFERTALTVKARTVPALSVDIIGTQDKFHINLLRHEIFSVIGNLNRSLRQPVEQWHIQHPGQRFVQSDNKPVHKDNGLRGIPEFLTSVTLHFEDLSMAMASSHFRGKENDVLGMRYVTNGLNVRYARNDLDSCEGLKLESDSDGRFFEISGSDFVLYKADGELIEMVAKGIVNQQMLEQRTVANLPSLALKVWTHSSEHTKIDLRIEPRLKAFLNINLILAYSVLKENLNKMLLRGEAKDKLDKEVEMFDKAADAAEERGDDEAAARARSGGREVQRTVKTEKHEINVCLPRVLIKIDMPSDDQLMFELCAANFEYVHGKNPRLTTDALRMYSRHPMRQEAWCILLSLVHVDLQFNKTNQQISDKVLLNVDGLRVNVPYKFKLYRIIDNGITLAKAIKTLILQTDTLDTMIVLDPKRIDKVFHLPPTRVLAKQIALSLEDDYFEADVTLCILTQWEAAEVRRQKLFRYDTKIKRMLVLGLRVLEEARAQHAEPSTEQGEAAERRISKIANGSAKNGRSADDNKARADNRDSKDKEPENDNYHHRGQSPTSFDFSGISARVVKFDDSVADRVRVAAARFKRSANSVLDHSVRPHDSNRQRSATPSNSSRYSSPGDQDSEEDQLHQLAQALADVPSRRIDALLRSGLELGNPSCDGDEAYMKDHPWLYFWGSPVFARFRAVKISAEVGKPGPMTVAESRAALLADFSKMWIDTIKRARMTQHYGVKKRREAVVKDRMNPDTCKEEIIVDYSQKPLVLSLDIRDVDLGIKTTTYDNQEKLHDFLYKIGKGQPKDSEFSILVPFHMDLKARDGIEVNLKDFPIPVLHFPGLARDQDPNANLAFRIHGDLIITEQLMNFKENLRRLFVPLKILPRELRKVRGSDVIEVHRTLTPIKTFTDLKTEVGTTLPTRVSWCMAYKAGFHSVGQAFSGFSKPPIDPSPALGVWDKIRLILHARFEFSFPKSTLAFIMKAGKSPYTLLHHNSGFVFAWRDNVRLRINPNDDPKHLFSVESDNFQLLVPNYIAWESEFLNRTVAERALPRKTKPTIGDDPDKVVFNFGQRTVWQLGMKFEKGCKFEFKDPETGKTSMMEVRDAKFRPHYDVRMSLPEYIDDVESYDAYRGFRSDFIYMSISVRSSDFSNVNEENSAPSNTDFVRNKNSAHLSMGVIQHFKIWKDQFNSDQWPPIRTGSLFPDPVRVRPSTRTFGTSLSTSSYQIMLNNLDLSMFQHLSSHRGNSGSFHSTGLKAKIDCFEFDWHTRREPPEVAGCGENEAFAELNGQRRWRMHSYKVQVRLKVVHMRAIEAKIRTVSTQQALHALHDDEEESVDSEDDIMDDDSTSMSDSDSQTVSMFSEPKDSFFSSGQSHHHGHYGPRYMSNDHWIDWDDFTEVDVEHRLRNKSPDVRVLPFIFTPEFIFVRNTDFTDKSVYIDPESGDRFPKFGSIDVQSYHMKSQPSGYTESELLRCRKAQLSENLADIQASYDSLESASGKRTKEEKELMVKLLALLKLAKLNEDVIDAEIKMFLDAAVRDKERLSDTRKKLSEDMLAALKQLNISDEEREPYEEKVNNPGTYIGGGVLGSELDSANFRNRYILHAMHLKWDNDVRDVVYRLIYSFDEAKELKYVRCRPAVQYLEELVDKAKAKAEEHERQVKEMMKKERADDARHKHEEQGETHHIAKIFKCDDQGESPANGHSFDENDDNSLDRRMTNKSDFSLSNLNKINTRESRFDKDNLALTHKTRSHGETCDSRFQGLFRALNTAQRGEIVHKSHFVYLPTPRIQLISKENPSKCLQVSTRNIELQVVDTYPEDSSYDDEGAKIERRFGAALNMANFFVLGEHDLNQYGMESLFLEPYSGDETLNQRPWPPWLVVELCYNPAPMRQFQVVRDVSFGVTYHKPNDLHVAENDEDVVSNDSDAKAVDSLERRPSGTPADEEAPEKFVAPEDKSSRSSTDQNTKDLGDLPAELSSTLAKHGEHKGKAILTSIVVDAPKIVLEVDSVQFYTLYTIITDLLDYKDPLIKKREDTINKLTLLNDFSGDHTASLGTIELLQKDIRSLVRLRERCIICSPQEENSAKVHVVKLDREILRRQTRLLVLIRALKASLRHKMDTGVEKFTKMSIMADGVDVVLLNETGIPLVELVLRRGHFSQLSSEDDRSVNRATLAGFSVRNLMKNSVYPQMLASFEAPDGSTDMDDAIKLRWTRLQRVGGIPVFDNADVQIKPMHIQFEHGLFEKLLDFAFPITSNENSNDKKSEDSSMTDSDDDSSSDESEISVSLSELEREGSEEKVREKKRQRLRNSGSKSKKNGFFKRLVSHTRSSSDGDSANAELGVDEFVNRASSYWSIRHLEIRPTDLVVSYRGKNHSLLNIQNLHIKFPGFLVKNKTWTKLDFVMKLKKLLIKILLGQSGTIIGNMMKRHKNRTSEDNMDVALQSFARNLTRELTSDSRVHELQEELLSDKDTEQTLRLLLVPFHRKLAIEYPEHWRDVLIHATAQKPELVRDRFITQHPHLEPIASLRTTASRLSGETSRRSHRNGSSANGSNGIQEFTNKARRRPSMSSLRIPPNRVPSGSQLGPSRSPRQASTHFAPSPVEPRVPSSPRPRRAASVKSDRSATASITSPPQSPIDDANAVDDAKEKSKTADAKAEANATELDSTEANTTKANTAKAKAEKNATKAEAENTADVEAKVDDVLDANDVPDRMDGGKKKTVNKENSQKESYLEKSLPPSNTAYKTLNQSTMPADVREPPAGSPRQSADISRSSVQDSPRQGSHRSAKPKFANIFKRHDSTMSTASATSLKHSVSYRSTSKSTKSGSPQSNIFKKIRRSLS